MGLTIKQQQQQKPQQKTHNNNDAENGVTCRQDLREN